MLYKMYLLEGAQDVVTRWTAVCCMLLPTTPTDYPSTTRVMSVGHTVAANIDFYGYHQFLSISFV